MLTISLIREKKEFIIERLKIKNFDAEEIINRILLLDSSRREIQSKTDALQGDMNRISKEIGSMMREGRRDEAETAKEKTFSIKEEIKSLTDKMIPIDNELRSEIIRLPNLPHESVPPGHGADDNVIVREGGNLLHMPDTALAHWDLIKKYDIIDFD